MGVKADWLADPTGRHELRYWDGTAWTAHVSDVGVQGDDPVDEQPSAPGASKMKSLVSSAVSTSQRYVAEKRAAKGDESSDPAPVSGGGLLTVTSHDEGRNAEVTVYPDRIERVKARSRVSLSRAAQDREVTPIAAVSSVQASKDGFRTKVTVYASGNEIVFRVGHDEAKRLAALITDLILGKHPTSPPANVPPGSSDEDVVGKLERLAALHQAGALTDEEYATQKARLLA